EDGIRDFHVTGVQTCALPIFIDSRAQFRRARELLETRTVSESQVQQLESTMNADEARLRAAQARFEQTLVRAPFAGRVGLRQIRSEERRVGKERRAQSER